MDSSAARGHACNYPRHSEAEQREAEESRKNKILRALGAQDDKIIWRAQDDDQRNKLAHRVTSSF